MTLFCKNLLVLSVIFFTTIFSSEAKDKPKFQIVTTTAAFGSLVKSVAGDEAEVHILHNSDSCPHHMDIKPSQLKLIEHADLVVYIDDEFETIISKIRHHVKGELIKISLTPGLRIIKGNWHIWLDLNNAKLFCNEIAERLAKHNFNKEILTKNLDKIYRELDDINNSYNGLFNSNSDTTKVNLLVVSNSLAYLLPENNYISHFPFTNNASLKQKNLLEETILKVKPKCIIKDSGLNKKLLNVNGVDLKIVTINSENWHINPTLDQVYQNNFIDIVKQLSHCF